MSHGPGVIQNNVRAINSVEGMKGLKFRVDSGVAGNAAKSLGVTGMLASATKNYPSKSLVAPLRTVLPGVRALPNPRFPV